MVHIAARSDGGPWGPDAGLPLGSYAIDVTTDTASTTVDCPVAEDTIGILCGDENGVLVEWNGSVITIAFETEPLTVTVRVSRDGSALATRSFTPKHGIVHPNGPECAPTCTIVYDETITL